MTNLEEAKKKARRKPCLWRTKSALLFLTFFFLARLDTALLLRLRLGLFHRLLGLGDFFGAGFGTLFALFIQHLFAAQQFEEGFVGAVTLVPAGADNARVSAIPVAETRANRVEQLDHRVAGHEVRRRQPPRREVASLAERNHLLDDGLRGLRLRNGRFDPLLHDHRRDQVPQQRAPVRGVPSEFVACYFVTHGEPQWSVASSQWPVIQSRYI